MSPTAPEKQEEGIVRLRGELHEVRIATAKRIEFLSLKPAVQKNSRYLLLQADDHLR